MASHDIYEDTGRVSGMGLDAIGEVDRASIG